MKTVKEANKICSTTSSCAKKKSPNPTFSSVLAYDEQIRGRSHPLQPDKYGLKLEVVLKWKGTYIQNIRVVSLIAGLTMKGIVK